LKNFCENMRENARAGSRLCIMNSEQETKMREWLAGYFLSPSAVNRQSEQYMDAVKVMAALETDAIIQSAGIDRPLQYGDVTGLIGAVLDAAGGLLKTAGVTLEYTLPEDSVYTAAEPRLMQIALARLLRTAARVGETIYADVALQKKIITVIVTGERQHFDRVAVQRAAVMLCEMARLHGGTVVFEGKTAVFSLRREQYGSVGLFRVPTPAELIADPLSPVRIGLISV